MYSYKTGVGYSECSPLGVITIPALIDHLQDCTMFHTASVGYGLEHYQSRKRAWFLASWQVVIDEMPKYAEYITLETRAYEFKSIYGMRNVTAANDEGEVMVKANAIWFLMDLNRGMPTKVPEEEVKDFGLDEKIDMDYAPRKLVLPEGLKDTGISIECRESFLDTNRHMNNGQYVRVAYEVLQKVGEGLGVAGVSLENSGFYPNVKELRVEYKKAAKFGDVLHAYTGTEGSTAFIDLCDKEGNSFASASFRCE